MSTSSPYTPLQKDAGQVTMFSLSEEKNYGSFQHQQAEPESGWWRSALSVALLGGLSWAALYLVLHAEVLPPGGLFQLLLLLTLAQLAGLLAGRLRLPPLLGMLLTGIALRTAGLLSLSGFYPTLVVISRNLALSVILIKAGLGLDPEALQKLKFTVLRLAVFPCLTEACVAALAAHLFFDVPWLWALLIGFILSPISPAVVVPTLLQLKEQGYGEDKGIATLVIAASSIDDILSISVFGVIITAIFTPAGDLTSSLIHGPAELVAGLAGGAAWGFLIGYLPHRHQAEWKQSALLGLGGFVAVVGSIEWGVPGAGPLLAIVSAFTANLLWARRHLTQENKVSERFGAVWSLVQPALFGLIGAEVDLTAIEPSLILSSLAILFSALAVRLVTCLVCLVGIGLNWREMVFVNLAWLPKATVQAALSPQPLDMLPPGDPQVPIAELLLTTAILSIIITAPLGSLGISFTGPRFLSRASLSPANA